MAAALAGYRKALIGTGLAISSCHVHGAVHMAVALEKPWSALAWPFLSLTQTGVDKAPLPL